MSSIAASRERGVSGVVVQAPHVRVCILRCLCWSPLAIVNRAHTFLEHALVSVEADQSMGGCLHVVLGPSAANTSPWPARTASSAHAVVCLLRLHGVRLLNTKGEEGIGGGGLKGRSHRSLCGTAHAAATCNNRFAEVNPGAAYWGAMF